MFDWLFNRIRQDDVTIAGSNTGRDSTTNHFGISVSEFEKHVADNVALEFKNRELERLGENLHKDLRSLAKINERVSSENLVNKMRVAGDFEKSWAAYNSHINYGLSGNSYIYNVLILMADRYSDATRVLFEMRKYRIPPNEYISSAIIKKADNYADALFVYESLKEQGVCDNEYILNNLIVKCENEYQALEIYNNSIELSLVNEYILASTLSKINSYKKSKNIFDNAKKLGVSCNNHVYSILLSKNMLFSEAIRFYKENISNDSPVNEYVCSALFGKAQSGDEIRICLELVGVEHLGANAHVIESLIRHSAGFEEAFGYYELLMLSGKQPDKHIYTALISKSESFVEALKTFDLLAKNDVEIDSHIIHSVMKSASSNQEVDIVLDKSDFVGALLDVHVYTEAIKRSSTSVYAKELYRRALMNGVVLDSYLYTCLISKLDEFEDAKSIYKDTIRNKVFDDWIVSALLSKAIEIEQVEWVFNNSEMYNLGKGCNFPFRFSSVRNGIHCIENIMRAGDFRPDNLILSKLYASPIDEDLTGQEVLDFSWRNKLSSTSLNAFVKRAAKIDLNHALNILLHYPHLTSGIPIFKRSKDESLQYFNRKLNDGIYINDARYALAICYFENNEYNHSLNALVKIGEAAIKEFPENKKNSIYDLISKCETLREEMR